MQLEALRNTSQVRSIINQISKLPASTCCLFPRYARKLFASYAVPFMVNIK